MLVLFIEYAKPVEPAERSQTTSSPANELHIFDSTTSATSLIIQNNNMMITSNITQGTSTSNVTTGTQAATPSFTTGGPSSSGIITSSIDKFMIFTDSTVNNAFTVPAGGLNCDILMIGGGGSSYYGGGGGAGACIVAINQTFAAGNWQISVGGGGITNGNVSNNGANTYIYENSFGYRYLAQGGGASGNIASGAATVNYAGSEGGCGGGAHDSTTGVSGGAAVSTNRVNGTVSLGPSITSTYAILGNRGTNSTSAQGGGGGGIGGPGVDVTCLGGDGAYQVTLTGAATPINFRSYFANGSTSFGVQDGSTGNYYIGGGGGGYISGYKNGGKGGGGGAPGVPGTVNTGSGGGNNQQGGSGIVIIRYRSGTTTTTYTHTPTITTTLSTPTLGTPSIELVRGTQGDANRDYKIGNYEGDFIIKSSVSSTDSDYLRLSGANGNTFNFTNSLNWNQTSDRRIKENIMRASYDMCYNNIDKLELNRFSYIKEFNTGNRDTNQLGFIAQEIKEIFPKAVFTNNYNSVDLSIPDMLSIDIGQINFTLYGAVKKLMEINKDKELRLKRLEYLLNVECGSDSSGDNVVIDSDVSIDTSNIILDTSNIVIDTSNITIDTSNLLATSNIIIDTSNIVIDTSNIAIDTSNIAIDTSNIAIDTSNIAIDTSNLLDTSNIAIDTSNI